MFESRLSALLSTLGMLVVFFAAPSAFAGQVTLEILNTPEPDGTIVVVSGEYVQLELTIDDPTGLSANDTIHLIGTNGQVVDQKRRANSTSFMLRANSDEATAVFVEYVAGGEVIATAPADPATPILVVADLVTQDLMQRVLVLEELCANSDIAQHVADPNAHHVAYTDAEAIAAVGPHFSGDHADLTNVTADQHHVRYADAEAITAVGPHFSGNHADLTNVTADQHHVRYADAEAITAVGPHFSGNHADLTNVTADQHHVRYADAEAITAVGPHFSGNHADLTNVTADQHHVQTPASALDAVVTVDENDLNGMPGPHVVFEANVHVVDGTGTTDCDNVYGCNGLGNLFVGYNETDILFTPAERAGSHNLVVGPYHRYTDAGGLVAGFRNTVSNDYATVSGGSNNTASGVTSSVSGGQHNLASGLYSSVSGGGGSSADSGNVASGVRSSVSGGGSNTASYYHASVSGGQSNEASWHFASVSGGYGNTASDDRTSVCGGHSNVADEDYASISGGYYGLAEGEASSISGGLNNVASGDYSSVSGGNINTASGQSASVSGGTLNTASGISSSVSGGMENEAYGGQSTVGGGYDRDALNYTNWAAGTLSEAN